MKNITQEARNLIERYNLGIPIEVYKTSIRARVIFGVIFMVFGSGWSLVAAVIVNGARSIMGLSSSSSLDPSSMPSSVDPSLLQSADPSWVQPVDPSSIHSSLSTGVDIFGIIFPLFGLLFAGIGLLMVVKAIRKRNNQAIFCTEGVAYVTRKVTYGFRWDEVFMVFNKTSISTSTMHNEYGGTDTSTNVSHRYAIHCHDGRRFVLDNSLSNVEDLAERIEVEIARRRVMAG